ncbi:pyridoxal phosphate-dependent transferase [Xylogone sp. PMI_703]|nr:pyridoxal phosphate-dependent transferase [Xylogone sp. PMI_703]
MTKKRKGAAESRKEEAAAMATTTTSKPSTQINLFRGWPNPSLLPVEALKRAANHALEKRDVAVPALLYGPDPGYGPLREQIASWLSAFYSSTFSQIPGFTGPPSTSTSSTAAAEASIPKDRIVITGGASQNLACACQVFSDPVRTLRTWMVAPSYFLAGGVFGDSGLVCGAAPEGKEGVDLEELERRIVEVERVEGGRKKGKPLKPKGEQAFTHLIYCVPTFSNPSGITMTLENRIGLVSLARKYNALIISDDVYEFLQYSASSSPSTNLPPKAFLPRLIDIDRFLLHDSAAPPKHPFGNVMSNGTFSKLLGPGIRTGWAEGSPELAYALAECGSTQSGGAASQFSAAIVSEMMLAGEVDPHIETLKTVYARRRGLVVQELEKVLRDLNAGGSVREARGWRANPENQEEEGIAGGYFIWIDLPPGVSSVELAARATEEENLFVSPGRIFEVPGDDSVVFDDGVRICYTWEEEDKLAEGIDRLGKMIKKLLAENASGGKQGGPAKANWLSFR